MPRSFRMIKLCILNDLPASLKVAIYNIYDRIKAINLCGRMLVAI